MAYDDLLGLIPEFGENFALLLALALLYSLIGLPLLRRAGHFGAVMAGLLFGGIAILGMRWPIAIAPDLSVDGRNLIVLTAGAFGGAWTALVSTIVVVAYRILMGARTFSARLPSSPPPRCWERRFTCAGGGGRASAGPASSWPSAWRWPQSACPGT